MNFSSEYLNECIEICKAINPDKIENMAELINSVRQDKGRIFFLESEVELDMPDMLLMIFVKYVLLKAMLQPTMYQN